MDAGLLMWNICRTATPFIELRDPFVIHFYLNDVPDNKADYWLIHKDKKVDISYIDRGYNIDQNWRGYQNFAKVWMGKQTFDDAITHDRMIIDGTKKLFPIAKTWLG